MTDAAPFFDGLAEGPAGGHAVWVRADDGVRLRVAVWPGGPRGTVIVLPGRTEPVEKYGRVAADLARRGWSAVSIDWRGQGLSDRLTGIMMTGHVGRFIDYQRDLGALMTVIETAGLPRPLHLLAHSMGGAIALRAVNEGLPVGSVAFTAPMWGIRITPSLRPLAWAIASSARFTGRGLTLAPGTELTSYLAIAPFEGNVLTTDAETFAWMKRQIAEQPELALGGPSLHWLHEALVECRRLRAMPSPAIPGLTFLGSLEKIVALEPIHRRMARWPKGRLHLVEGAEHEVLMERPTVRSEALARICDLFDTAG